MATCVLLVVAVGPSSSLISSLAPSTQEGFDVLGTTLVPFAVAAKRVMLADTFGDLRIEAPRLLVGTAAVPRLPGPVHGGGAWQLLNLSLGRHASVLHLVHPATGPGRTLRVREQGIERGFEPNAKLVASRERVRIAAR